MVAKFQYVAFWFEHIFFVQRKLKFLDYLNGHLLVWFLWDSFVHWWEITFSYFLRKSETIIHTHGLVLLQMAHPFISYGFWLEKESFLRINPIPVLDNEAKLSSINFFNRQSFHVDDLDRFVWFGSIENKECSFRKIHILMSFLIFFQ